MVPPQHHLLLARYCHCCDEQARVRARGKAFISGLGQSIQLVLGAFMVSLLWDSASHYLTCWRRLGTFALVHATFIAACLVPSPLIKRLQLVHPMVINAIGISVPLLWIATTLPLYQISSKNTKDAYDVFQKVSAQLHAAAALSDGFPVPPSDPKFASELHQMEAYRLARIHYHQTGEAIRAGWQIIMVSILGVGGVVYLDSIKTQIFTVLPDLRERSSLWGGGDLSKASSLQRKRISNLLTQYRLMLLVCFGPELGHSMTYIS